MRCLLELGRRLGSRGRLRGQRVRLWGLKRSRLWMRLLTSLTL